MSKRVRQYLGVISAIVAYYIVHEGAHLLVALCMGVFKSVKFMGVGIQIDVESALMSDTQMGVFCLAGALSTWVAAYLLVLLSGNICKSRCVLFRAVMYYITIAMLVIDPVYLSVVCGMVGGGDMNGIALLVPEAAARVAAGILLVVNVFVFLKIVLPRYVSAQRRDEKEAS